MDRIDAHEDSAFGDFKLEQALEGRSPSELTRCNVLPSHESWKGQNSEFTSSAGHPSHSSFLTDMSSPLVLNESSSGGETSTCSGPVLPVLSTTDPKPSSGVCLNYLDPNTVQNLGIQASNFQSRTDTSVYACHCGEERLPITTTSGQRSHLPHAFHNAWPHESTEHLMNTARPHPEYHPLEYGSTCDPVCTHEIEGSIRPASYSGTMSKIEPDTQNPLSLNHYVEPMDPAYPYVYSTDSMQKHPSFQSMFDANRTGNMPASSITNYCTCIDCTWNEKFSPLSVLTQPWRDVNRICSYPDRTQQNTLKLGKYPCNQVEPTEGNYGTKNHLSNAYPYELSYSKYESITPVHSDSNPRLHDIHEPYLEEAPTFPMAALTDSRVTRRLRTNCRQWQSSTQVESKRWSGGQTRVTLKQSPNFETEHPQKLPSSTTLTQLLPPVPIDGACCWLDLKSPPFQAINICPSLSLSENNSHCPIQLRLRDLKVWLELYTFGTEMIATNTGRRVFPSLSLQVSGLDPNEEYIFALEMLLVRPHIYRHQAGQWVISSQTDDNKPTERSCKRLYVQEDSPKSGAYWMESGVNFSKMKITNSKLQKNPSMITVSSMRQYIPRFSVFRMTRSLVNNLDGSGYRISTAGWKNAQNIPELVGSYVIPGTQFYTVTAYQNPDVIRVKIDNNPFAKGFRNRKFTNEFEDFIGTKADTIKNYAENSSVLKH
ncbi:T-box, partial [Opisthorchis viverrini]